MALMTCRSCGHYYVTPVTVTGQPPRCPPCHKSRSFGLLAELRRYLRGHLRGHVRLGAERPRDRRGRE